MLSIFHVYIGHLYVFFREMSRFSIHFWIELFFNFYIEELYELFVYFGD